MINVSNITHFSFSFNINTSSDELNECYPVNTKLTKKQSIFFCGYRRAKHSKRE